jgi:hypothetical protein
VAGVRALWRAWRVRSEDDGKDRKEASYGLGQGASHILPALPTGAASYSTPPAPAPSDETQNNELPKSLNLELLPLD